MLETSFSGETNKRCHCKNILLSCVMFHRVRLIYKNIFISLFAKVETVSVSVSVCHYHWWHYITIPWDLNPSLYFFFSIILQGILKSLNIKQSQVLKLKTLTDWHHKIHMKLLLKLWLFDIFIWKLISRFLHLWSWLSNISSVRKSSENHRRSGHWKVFWENITRRQEV